MVDRIQIKAASAPRRLRLLSLLLLLLPLLLAALAGASAQTSSRGKRASKKAAAPPPAAAAPATAPAPASVPPPPDPFGRSTPRGTVLGFLRAAESQDYARAVKYLDTRLPEQQAEQLASQLKALFDLGTSTELETFSRLPEGNLQDRLPVSREKVGVVTTPAATFDILLDRSARPNESPIWLFSHETLDRVPSAYASTRHTDFSRYFPAWTSRVRILSIPLWRWAGGIIFSVLALVLARLLSRLVRWILRLSFRHRMTRNVERAIARLNGPTFGLMLALLQRITGDYAITALARRYWILGSILTAIVSTAWLLVRLTDISIAFFTQRLLFLGQIERITLVGMLAKMLKILIVIILVIVLLTIAGVNVTALVTGLGIGGVALALASQKTLADLFGGISIVMRGAVRVNDACNVAGKSGTVEEIGISALRLRTLDRSVISIPNSKVAEMELENYSMRDQFWIHQTFTLRFDTSHTTVRKVLDDIFAILTHRPDIDESSARIRIVRLTPAGPEIEVFAYYNKPGSDYNSFLAEQETIILEMMRLIEEAGTSMTSPIGIVSLDSEQSRPPEQQNRPT
jgi:MscS family membrane protein